MKDSVAEYTKWFRDLAEQQGIESAGAEVFRLPRELLEEVGYTDDMSVLDYGCGWGSLLTQVNPKDYLGVDISPVMIAAAQERFPDREFKVIEIGEVDTDQKDVVVAHSVFTHIPLVALPLAMKDVIVNLKPGGFAVIDIFQTPAVISATYSKEEWVELWAAEGFTASFVVSRVRNDNVTHFYYKISK